MKNLAAVTVVAALAVGIVVGKRFVREDESVVEPRTQERADLPQLIEFAATWCKPCVELKPIMNDLRREYRGKVNVRIVDVDEQPEFAAQFGLFGVPTIVYLDENGQEQFRYVGLVSKHQLVAALAGVGVERS
ncbi:MAG: thioredoxin family protein [Armatimonadota bacterium]